MAATIITAARVRDIMLGADEDPLAERLALVGIDAAEQAAAYRDLALSALRQLSIYQAQNRRLKERLRQILEQSSQERRH